MDHGPKSKAVNTISKYPSRGRLHKNYGTFEEFEHYDDYYNLAKRLGYPDATTAWEENPIIVWSSFPEDYQICPRYLFWRQRWEDFKILKWCYASYLTSLLISHLLLTMLPNVKVTRKWVLMEVVAGLLLMMMSLTFPPFLRWLRDKRG